MFSLKWFAGLAAALLIAAVVAVSAMSTSPSDRNVPGHTTGPKLGHGLMG
jgi:hypothetical protein